MTTTACSRPGYGTIQQLRLETLNRLPLYRRIRSFSCMAPDDHKPDSGPGARTPPPAYYDSGSLAEPSVPAPTAAPEPASTGYLPDTGTKRLLKSLASLLTADAPVSDLVSTWLGTPHSLTPPPPSPPPSSTPPARLDCNCFSCFQQHHLYLLWLQQATTPTPPPLHHNAIPPPKPLLHRITASLVVNVFTAAFVLYPHVKTALTSSYAWERRNRVLERVLAAAVGVVGQVWGLLLWVLGLGTEMEVEVGCVNRWLVRVGGEVLGGVLDGTQIGVGVWGVGVVG